MLFQHYIMRLKIIQYPNDILLSPSEEVTQFDDSLKKLIADMIETCERIDNCVGLAAVQVGILKQISVIKSGKKYIHIINPKVLYASSGVTYEWEGCMSVGSGEDQLFSKIGRDPEITVRYNTMDGRMVTRRCRGFLAHAFQHEIDHMNGILFLRYVKDPSRLWKDKDLNTYIKEHNHLPL